MTGSHRHTRTVIMVQAPTTVPAMPADAARSSGVTEGTGIRRSGLPRKVDSNEAVGRIEIILARLVDDADEAAPPSGSERWRTRFERFGSSSHPVGTATSDSSFDQLVKLGIIKPRRKAIACRQVFIVGGTRRM